MAFKRFVHQRPYLALLMLAIVLGVIAWLLLRGRPPRLAPGVLAPDQPVTADDRVVIVAPHCDDETLGAGGLLHDAVAAGAEVHVIMVTNGDGFRYAVEAERRTLRPSPESYIQFAYQRQQETLAAVRLLGLPPENVIFLGYPDRGTAHMWSANWSRSNPYRSQFTGLTNSPYNNSFSPNAPYAGEQLAADLATLLIRYKPTLIVFPHPNDAHPDHWAVNAFINYTLQSLSDQGEAWASTVKQRLYLVHRGEWPNPKGLHMQLSLLPPKPLLRTQTHWITRNLSSDIVTLKRDAILAYHSQMLLLRSYLLSFARQNELYGELAPTAVPFIPDAQGPDREPPALSDGGLARVITDAAGDTVARRVEAAADIITVDAGRSATHLILKITMRGAVRPDIGYSVHLVPLGAIGSTGRARLDLRFSPPNKLSPTSVPPAKTAAIGASAGSTVSLSVPLSELGRPRLLYISVDTSLAQLGIDRAAWTLIDLAGESEVSVAGGP